MILRILVILMIVLNIIILIRAYIKKTPYSEKDRISAIFGWVLILALYLMYLYTLNIVNEAYMSVKTAIELLQAQP